MTQVVNWGCRPSVLRRLNIIWPVLNADISLACGKVSAFTALQGAGLPVPRFTTNHESVLPDRPDRAFYRRGKYLARRDHLTGGAGIEVVESGEQPTAAYDFCVQVVAKAHEVRLHVLGTEVRCEQVKYVPVGSNVLIRNYDNGARFSAKPIDRVMDSDIANIGRDIAVRAAAACHLNFTAIDMALTRNGEWVIFELNSAPGITRREENDEAHLMSDSYTAYYDYFQQFVVR